MYTLQKKLNDLIGEYKKEIEEYGGYSKYIASSLNRLAKTEEDYNFHVSIKFVDVNIPEVPCKEIVVKRSYNALTSNADVEKELECEFLWEKGFRPEPWQYSMLQSIRDNKSILIMAPTSSGKTLAAKYAMRKVCKDNLGLLDAALRGKIA